MKYTITDLRQKQSLDLDAKVRMTQNRIRQWYEHWDGQVYVAFSGGKDSTVLLRLVRELYPEVPGVFCDTGLEYPEIREFIKGAESAVWLKPKMGFRAVIEKYGYPVISKKVSRQIRTLQNPTPENVNTRRLYWDGIRQDGTKTTTWKLSQKWRYLVDAPFRCSELCCDVMKKKPFAEYEKEANRRPFIGTTADNSRFRLSSYLASGCNSFKRGKEQSRPLSFWLEGDVWKYLHSKNVPYCRIYDMGERQTGCMFCMFAIMYDGQPNRFQRMQKTHPKQWKFCMDKLGLRDVLKYIGVPCEWQESDPKLFEI